MQLNSQEEVLPVSLSPALVVEDDPVMQRRLCRVLAAAGCAVEQVAIADSVAQARRLLAERSFGVALVDIGLPDGSGIDLVGELQARHPLLPAVVISAFRADDIILAALRAGAIGYLLKERDDLELERALRSIAQGGAPIDPAIARGILALLTRPQPVTPDTVDTAKKTTTPEMALSRRENNILELVAQGLSNREMAETLSISRLTVECHTKNIYRKLAVNSRTEAVYTARTRGLLR
ncbi:response regulator transcription factor [Polaromonas sp.]|uniref:response regulator transcription factor n=1 Tax=Polaromonas sp. TaxID=1869339 RepID=UPI0032670AEC